ncbi:integrase core domain-containing protein [Gilliamella sp. BG2]
MGQKHGIIIDYIKPGSPYQNGYIERFITPKDRMRH